MNKKRDIILFISIFCMLSLIAGGTYAYWSWDSGTNNSVVFNTSKGVAEYIVYDAGTSNFVGDFKTSSNYCGGMSNTLSFYKKTEAINVGLTATIKMKVNHIGSNISLDDSVHWVLVSGNKNVCSGSINSGTFVGKKSGDEIVLLQNEAVTTTNKTYTVWIWVDGDANGNISGETIDVNVWTQIDMTDASDWE